MFASMAFRASLFASLYVLSPWAQDPDASAAVCLSGTCAPDFDEAVKGSAMIQVRKTSAEACSTDNAKQVPLTDAGFQQISKSCCYEDVKVFARRLIDDMGLKVCDEGGLSGIAPFYSCPLSPVTLAELKEDVKKALPSADNKCHWLQERYAECSEPALECAVSAQKPPPAPKPVASGFFAFKVTNPSEMMRNSKAVDAVKQELALSLGVPTENVNIVIGSGPLDGEEAVSSLFIVPQSQAFISVEGAATVCKVFAVFSIQEPASKTSSITTPAPTLDEEDIVKKLKHLDTVGFAKKLTQDLNDVDRPAGAVEVIEEAVCEKTSLKCTHAVCRDK